MKMMKVTCKLAARPTATAATQKIKGGRTAQPALPENNRQGFDQQQADIAGTKKNMPRPCYCLRPTRFAKAVSGQLKNYLLPRNKATSGLQIRSVAGIALALRAIPFPRCRMRTFALQPFRLT